MNTAEQILAALGGKDNVLDIEPCITRLRVEVAEPGAVDDDALKTAGAFGVVRTGRVVQVIVGPAADGIAAALEALR